MMRKMMFLSAAGLVSFGVLPNRKNMLQLQQRLELQQVQNG